MRPARKNFILGVIHEGFWGLGYGLIAPAVILSLALVDLGYSAFAIGWLIALFSAGTNLPQVFSALLLPPRFTEPKALAWLHAPAVVGPLVVGLGFLLLPSEFNTGRMVLLFTGFGLQILGTGIAVPHWIACMGRCIPRAERGRYFGISFFLSALTSTFSGWLGAHWAAQGGLHWGYAACFCLASPCFLVGAMILAWLEPLHAPPQALPPNALRSNLVSFFKKLTALRSFRAALILAILMVVVATPGNFFTVYLRKTMDVDVSWFQIFNPAASVGSMLGAFLVGHLIDRVNMRAAFLTSFSVALGALALIFFLPQPPYPALAFACAGFFGSFVPVGTMTMILNLTDKKESTVRIGLFNTLVVPFQLASPGIMGWLADKAGYEWIFFTAALACGAAFWILTVKAPFEKTTKGTLTCPARADKRG